MDHAAFAVGHIFGPISLIQSIVRPYLSALSMLLIVNKLAVVLCSIALDDGSDLLWLLGRFLGHLAWSEVEPILSQILRDGVSLFVVEFARMERLESVMNVV